MWLLYLAMQTSRLCHNLSSSSAKLISFNVVYKLIVGLSLSMPSYSIVFK